MLRINLLLNEGEELSGYSMEVTEVQPKSPLQYCQPHCIKDFIVFQFRYDGSMPLYDKDKEYLALMRDYYYQTTIHMYDYQELNFTFDKAIVIIQHVFPQKNIRDFDNRNRKYLLDAIRRTGLIKDDSIHDILIHEEAYIQANCEPFVNVLLLEEKNYYEFYKMKNQFVFSDKNNFSHVYTVKELKNLIEAVRKDKKEKQRLNKDSEMFW